LPHQTLVSRYPLLTFISPATPTWKLRTQTSILVPSFGALSMGCHSATGASRSLGAGLRRPDLIPTQSYRACAIPCPPSQALHSRMVGLTRPIFCACPSTPLRSWFDGTALQRLFSVRVSMVIPTTPAAISRIRDAEDCTDRMATLPPNCMRVITARVNVPVLREDPPSFKERKGRRDGTNRKRRLDSVG
jgi:hypothetical protein